MTALVTTNVTLEFRDDNLGPPDVVLRKDTIEPPYGHALARMYFVGSRPLVLSTSGYPVYSVNAAVTSDEISTLAFTGKQSADFPVPNISNVTLRPMGSFYNLKGEVVTNVTFKVDTARGIVTADQALYGTVIAEYNSTYERLQCQFLTIAGAKEDTRYLSEFADMVLVAQQEGAVDPVSLVLTAPDKGSNSGGYGDDDKASGQHIVMEVDTTHPVSLAHRGLVDGSLCAVARVWVYASTSGLKLEVSNGVIEHERWRLAESIKRKETLNFVSASSTSTKYPPANGVTTKPLPGMTSRDTPGSNFHFVSAPAQVSVGEWSQYGLYQTTGVRDVGNNEVAATTSGVTVAVSGQVEVEYNTLRISVDVYWGMGNSEWFQPCVLTATDSYGRVESITINPPTRRGI